MTRKCECGHALDRHIGFFGDCLGRDPEHWKACDCRWFEEAPSFHYLRRLIRWLREVPR